MTADEARELLGVEPGADSRAVRKAYLRLLKRHKPETDPEGFQRLREAFELAQRLAEAEPHSAIPTTPSVEPLPPPHTEPSPPRPAQVFWHRLQVAGNDGEAARHVLVEAIATCPDEPEFFLELAEMHAARGHVDATVEVLQAGARQGHVECAVELLHWRPAAIGPEALERFAPELHFGDAARGYISLDQPERAFELTRDALLPERWLRESFAYDLVAAFDVALALMDAGSRDVGQTAERQQADAASRELGRRLGKQTLAAARESGTALAAGRAGGVRWSITTELLALTPALPRGIEQAVVTSILRATAFPYRFAWEALERAERRAIDARLEREAPMLHQFLTSVGAAPPLFVEPSSRWWIAPLVITLMYLLRPPLRCESRDDYVTVEQMVEDGRNAQRREEDQEAHGGETPLTDEELEPPAREAATALCAPGPSPACDRAYAVLVAWRRRDCRALLAPQGATTTGHARDAGGVGVVLFEPELPPPLAEMIRRCEDEALP